MYLLIGYGIVVFSVFGGFMMAGGHLGALFQPLEVLMIVGAAVGAFIAANPKKKIIKVGKIIPKLVKPSSHTPKAYLDLLTLLFEIMNKSKRDGMIALESDIENPGDSELFKKYGEFYENHKTAVEFLCDYLRLVISGNMDPNELESLMDHEIITVKQELGGPTHAMQAVADGMPAFGIVAAVMGVVHTMSSVASASSAELGLLIAHALVGTFLGILLSYGFIAPIVSLMGQKADESIKMLECIKVVIICSLHNYAPQISVEFGRKILFTTVRPSFIDLEASVKAAKRS